MAKDQIKSDVSFILDTLDVSAQKATATPDIQQGTIGTDKRILHELNIINQKDTRYSLSAKVFFGWSEKRFGNAVFII